MYCTKLSCSNDNTNDTNFEECQSIGGGSEGTAASTCKRSRFRLRRVSPARVALPLLASQVSISGNSIRNVPRIFELSHQIPLHRHI